MKRTNTPYQRKLTAQQQEDLLALLWDYMKKDRYDRVQTGWGTKTQTGLLCCIEAIIDRTEVIAEICDGPTAVADARLIAAAPELKNLLSHALHYIETPGDFTEHERLELCQDIDNVIAKAEGQEPRP